MVAVRTSSRRRVASVTVSATGARMASSSVRRSSRDRSSGRTSRRVRRATSCRPHSRRSAAGAAECGCDPAAVGRPGRIRRCGRDGRSAATGHGRAATGRNVPKANAARRRSRRGGRRRRRESGEAGPGQEAAGESVGPESSGQRRCSGAAVVRLRACAGAHGRARRGASCRCAAPVAAPTPPVAPAPSRRARAAPGMVADTAERRDARRSAQRTLTRCPRRRPLATASGLRLLQHLVEQAGRGLLGEVQHAFEARRPAVVRIGHVLDIRVAAANSMNRRMRPWNSSGARSSSVARFKPIHCHDQVEALEIVVAAPGVRAAVAGRCRGARLPRWHVRPAAHRRDSRACRPNRSPSARCGARCCTTRRNTPSAVGERQMLPMQTNSTRIYCFTGARPAASSAHTCFRVGQRSAHWAASRSASACRPASR